MEVWRYGGMEVWRYGGMEVWRYGGMAVWRYGGREDREVGREGGRDYFFLSCVHVRFHVIPRKEESFLLKVGVQPLQNLLQQTIAGLQLLQQASLPRGCQHLNRGGRHSPMTVQAKIHEHRNNTTNAVRELNHDSFRTEIESGIIIY